MAIAATIEWEVRTTGTASNANGGGYKPGASGTDFSQQNAAQYNLTLVTTAAADAILLSASAAADMVGNLAHIVSGTNFTVGWYEIISIVAGVSITLDRTCTTAAGASGVVNIGGALSFGSADDAVFESMEPGNIMHIQTGSYTMGAVGMTKDGTSALLISLRGYNAARNDAPTGANRPVLAFAGNTSTFGDYMVFEDISVTTTASLGLSLGTGGLADNCKSVNSSGSADRNAFTLTNNTLVYCEAVSTAGDAASLVVGGCAIRHFYAHDSSNGIDFGAQNNNVVQFAIIDTIVSKALSFGSTADSNTVSDVTLYGASTPAGSSIGIDLAATTGINNRFDNIIISGFVDPIKSAAVVGSNSYRYINIHNCSNAVTNVTLGEGSGTDDPGFVDAPNGNFAVGTNMKATGGPAAFPGGLSTGYLDRGAVQRQEPAGGSGGGLRIVAPGGLG